MKKRYPSDITDAQWAVIQGFYAGQYNVQGRPPSKNLREIWNAILYMLARRGELADAAERFSGMENSV